jgi:hypothetical protein
MCRKFIMPAGVVTLAFALLAVLNTARSAADDTEKKDVPKDVADAVKKMVDDAAKDGDLKAAAAAFKQKYSANKDLKKAMWVFAKRDADGKGGFGVGPKLGAGDKDGIELLIDFKGHPTRNKITAEDLKEYGADFIRVANISLALAEITHQYKPTKKEKDKDPADWVMQSDAMKKSAKDLKAAVKENNPEKVKQAFVALKSSCTNCHSIFREEP